MQRERGQRLLATRYIIANGSVWDARYVWKTAVLDLPEGKAHVTAVEALLADVRGQAIVKDLEGVRAAITKVLGVPPRRWRGERRLYSASPSSVTCPIRSTPKA